MHRPARNAWPQAVCAGRRLRAEAATRTPPPECLIGQRFSQEATLSLHSYFTIMYRMPRGQDAFRAPDIACFGHVIEQHAASSVASACATRILRSPNHTRAPYQKCRHGSRCAQLLAPVACAAQGRPAHARLDYAQFNPLTRRQAHQLHATLDVRAQRPDRAPDPMAPAESANVISSI